MSLIYLASPYSHHDPVVMQLRFEEVCRVAALFMGRGIHIFSPIAHTHPIALAGELPRGFEFWEAYDREILAACSGLWILMIDGWKESKGIAAEITIAKEIGLDVTYIHPHEVDNPRDKIDNQESQS